MVRLRFIISLLLVLSLVVFAADSCQGSSKTTAKLMGSINDMKKSIDAVLFYEDADGNSKPIAYDRVWVWVYGGPQGTQETKDIIGLLTDSQGKITFDTSKYAKGYEQGCYNFRFIYCPLSYSGDGTSPLIPSTEITESKSCFDSFKPSLFDAPSDSQLTILDSTATLTGKLPPDNYKTPAYPFYGTYEEMQYCVPNNAASFAFCMPLVIIFALLGGALYLSGKNPLAGFDFTVPRMGKHVKYSPSGRGTAIDVGGMMSAVGASGKDIYSLKATSLPKESAKGVTSELAGAKKGGVDKKSADTTETAGKGAEQLEKIRQVQQSAASQSKFHEAARSGKLTPESQAGPKSQTQVGSSGLAATGMSAMFTGSNSLLGSLPIIGAFTGGKQIIKDYKSKGTSSFLDGCTQVTYAILMKSNLAPFLAPVRFAVEVGGGEMYYFLNWLLGAIGGTYMWSNANAFNIFKEYSLSKDKDGKFIGEGKEVDGKVIGFTVEKDGVKIWVKDEKGEWVEMKKDATMSKALASVIADFEVAARTVASQQFQEYLRDIKVKTIAESGMTDENIKRMRDLAKEKMKEATDPADIAAYGDEIALYDTALGEGENTSSDAVIAARWKLLTVVQDAEFETKGVNVFADKAQVAKYSKDMATLEAQDKAIGKIDQVKSVFDAKAAEGDAKYKKFMQENPTIFDDLKAGKNVDANLAKLDGFLSQKGTKDADSLAIVKDLASNTDAFSRMPEHEVLNSEFNEAKILMGTAKESLQARALYDPQAAAILTKYGSLMEKTSGSDADALRAMNALYSHAETVTRAEKEKLPSALVALDNKTSADVYRLREMDGQVEAAKSLAFFLENFRTNMESKVSERDDKLEELNEKIADKKERMKEAKTPYDSLKLEREISELEVKVKAEEDKYSSAMMETATLAFGAMRSMAYSDVAGELSKQAAQDNKVTDEEKGKIFFAASIAKKEMENYLVGLNAVANIGMLTPNSHYIPQDAEDYKATLVSEAFAVAGKKEAAKSMDELAGQVLSGAKDKELSEYAKFMDDSMARNSSIADAAAAVHQAGNAMVEKYGIDEALANQYMEKKGSEILGAEAKYRQDCQDAKLDSTDESKRIDMALLYNEGKVEYLTEEEYLKREKNNANWNFARSLYVTSSDPVISSIRNDDERSLKQILQLWEHAELNGEKQYAAEFGALSSIQKLHDDEQRTKIDEKDPEQFREWVGSNQNMFIKSGDSELAEAYRKYSADPLSAENAKAFRDAVVERVPDAKLDDWLGIDSEKYADSSKAIGKAYDKMQDMTDAQQAKTLASNNYTVLQATAEAYKDTPEYKNLAPEQRKEFDETADDFKKGKLTGKQFSEFIAEKLPDSFADSFVKSAAENTEGYMMMLGANKGELENLYSLAKEEISQSNASNPDKRLEELEEAKRSKQDLADFVYKSTPGAADSFKRDKKQEEFLRSLSDEEVNRLAEHGQIPTTDESGAAISKDKLVKTIAANPSYDDALDQAILGKEEEKQPCPPEMMRQELAVVKEMADAGDARAKTVYDSVTSAQGEDLKKAIDPEILNIDTSQFSFVPDVAQKVDELKVKAQEAASEEKPEAETETSEEEPKKDKKSKKSKKS